MPRCQMNITPKMCPDLVVVDCVLPVLDVGTRQMGEKIPHEQQIKFFGKVSTHLSF